MPLVQKTPTPSTFWSPLPTVTTTLRQQGRVRVVWEFLEHTWIAHRRGGVMSSLLKDS